MAPIIDDKEIAASVIEAIKAETRALQVETGVTPGLAVVLVGDDPASRTYVAAKSRMAKECGFTSIQHTLAADTKQDELSELVASLNADSSVHGGSGANRSSRSSCQKRTSTAFTSSTPASSPRAISRRVVSPARQRARWRFCGASTATISRASTRSSSVGLV
jgi:Tetrahydrofolate dehydrogenase/cyclohydrolase, catalytic domain